MKENKILCFDVSYNRCSVAISEGQNILFFEEIIEDAKQAELLIVLIERSLSDTNLSYNDIDYLAVTTGPGSFTAVRIGLAVAKGIVRASKNIKPIPIDNFESVYYRLKMQVKNYEHVVIMLNAYRNQIYMREYHHGKSDSIGKLIDNSSVRDLLSNYDYNIICAGSGVYPIYKSIYDLNHVTILPRFPAIKTLHIARYADNLIKCDSVNIKAIEPLYIRPPVS